MLLHWGSKDIAPISNHYESTVAQIDSMYSLTDEEEPHEISPFLLLLFLGAIQGKKLSWTEDFLTCEHIYTEKEDSLWGPKYFAYLQLT